MNSKIESKIFQALKSNKLNPKILGSRSWYSYYITTTELIWARNNHDGYQIEVYSDFSKREHLVTLKV